MGDMFFCSSIDEDYEDSRKWILENDHDVLPQTKKLIAYAFIFLSKYLWFCSGPVQD